MSDAPVRYAIFLVLASVLGACGSTPAASTLPASETISGASTSDESIATEAAIEPARTTIHARGFRADELLEAAGLATFLADRDLRVASVDYAAMERWFTHRPSALFVYAERPVEIAAGASVRGECQRVATRRDDVVLNQLSIVISRRGGERVVVALGQESVSVLEESLEDGDWVTGSARTLPVGAIAWDDAHVVYAEAAELYEVACVPTLRRVPCVEDRWEGPLGYCVDQELVARPFRAPFVPHVGPVSPAYDDAVPALPEGSCDVECEPSACGEALQRSPLPRGPLYSERDPVLAAFRTQAACRAFASSRGAQTPSGGAW